MCYVCNTCICVWVFACVCVNVNMCGSWKSIVGISLHCGCRISLETRVHRYGYLTSQFAVGAHRHLPGAGITGEPSTWHVHWLWRSELQFSHLKGKCIKFHEDTVHQSLVSSVLVVVWFLASVASDLPISSHLLSLRKRKWQRCLYFQTTWFENISKVILLCLARCFFVIQSWFFYEFCTNRRKIVATLGLNRPWKCISVLQPAHQF